MARPASPVIAGGVLYVSGRGDVLLALDAESGAERWRFEEGGFVHTAPAVVDGAIYVGTGRWMSGVGALYALADDPELATITAPEPST